MSEQTRIYLAIDLKSFYASVECQARKLNPLTTNLVGDIDGIIACENKVCYD